MKKFTITSFKKAGRLSALLALTAAMSAPSYAQTWERVYADGQTNGGTIILSSVGSATNAVGTDLSDYSSLSITGLGNVWQRLTFPEAPGTNTVHVKLGTSTGLASLATGLSIRIYNGATLVEEETLGSLITLLNGEDQADVAITPSSSYTAVEVRYSGIALGGSIRVYAAYFDKTASTDIACNSAADILSGSTGGLAVGITTAVDNAENAIDGDETTFASLNELVGALNTTHVTALYTSKSKPGDSVRVVFADPGGLVDLTALASRMSISTFDGNTETALLDGGTLLSLRLLPGSTGVQEMVIPTDVPFDRIQVSIGGLATALGTLNVYEIGKVIPAPSAVIDTVRMYAGVGTTPTLNAAATDADDDVVWYATSTPSGEPLFTGGSYTLTSSPAASQSYYAFTSRSGCTEASKATEVYVMVRPVTFNAPTADDAEFTPGEPYEFDLSVLVGEDGGVPDFSYYESTADPHTTGGFGTLAVGIPPGLTLATNGTLSGTPDPSPEPEYTFSVNVYDALDNPVVLGAPVTLANAAPLPVSFVSFTAKAMQNNTALLQWKTASEENNSHFDIERSADARNFVKVGSIKGNGTTTESHDYTFSDKVQEGTAVVYYRIRQVDLDGKSSLTEVRKVEFGKAEGTVITIYPNPSDSRISIETKNQDVSSISVYDLSGRQVALITDVKQNNQLTLSSGLYMVNAVDASGNILSTAKVTIR